MYTTTSSLPSQAKPLSSPNKLTNAWLNHMMLKSELTTQTICALTTQISHQIAIVQDNRSLSAALVPITKTP
jgi:hypothetical protein